MRSGQPVPTPPVRDPSTVTPGEKRIYSSMSEHMNSFHNEFRRTWRLLAANTDPTLPKPAGSAKLSATGIINNGLSFLSHLTLHHNIEETYIFPQLGQRMPAFRARVEAESTSHKSSKEDAANTSASTKDGEAGDDDIATVLLEQHKQIHKGMDQLEKYLTECKRGDRDFRREEVWDTMKGWEKVLFLHLDQEVEELAWNKMCQYWNVDEIRYLYH